MHQHRVLLGDGGVIRFGVVVDPGVVLVGVPQDDRDGQHGAQAVQQLHGQNVPGEHQHQHLADARDQVGGSLQVAEHIAAAVHIHQQAVLGLHKKAGDRGQAVQDGVQQHDAARQGEMHHHGVHDADGHHDEGIQCAGAAVIVVGGGQDLAHGLVLFHRHRAVERLGGGQADPGFEQVEVGEQLLDGVQLAVDAGTVIGQIEPGHEKAQQDGHKLAEQAGEHVPLHAGKVLEFHRNSNASGKAHIVYSDFNYKGCGPPCQEIWAKKRTFCAFSGQGRKFVWIAPVRRGILNVFGFSKAFTQTSQKFPNFAV